MQIVCDKNTKRAEIIKALNHIMIDQDIKNKDVAPRLETTPQTVSNLLNPNYRPDASMTIDTLYTLCRALNCQLVIDIIPMDKD